MCYVVLVFIKLDVGFLDVCIFKLVGFILFLIFEDCVWNFVK